MHIFDQPIHIQHHPVLREVLWISLQQHNHTDGLYAACMLQVGTYIGERLIYAPSIGFCILVAELLANLAGDALPQILLLWYSGGCKPAPSPAFPSLC